MTFTERRGPIQGKKVAWFGDANNVCHSWLEAACQFDFSLCLACPPGHGPDAAAMAAAGGRAALVEDPREAATGAQLLVTDVWTSMHQESGQPGDDAERRRQRAERFRAYQLNAEKRAIAAADALCMHCLPAHRGEEISAELLDAPDAAIWEEAENRLHTQKALLEFLLRR